MNELRTGAKVSGVFQRLERTYVALFREYPSLVRLGVITGSGQIALALVNIYALPFYMVQDLGLSGKMLGAASATFLVCETILKFPMGRLSDRLGRKAFIVLGPLLICLNPTIIARLPARLWALVFPLRAIDGAGAAALWPPLFAMIGDLVRGGSRAAAMSAINAVYIVAIGIAAALGAFVAHASHSNRAPFYVASALLMISAVVGYLGLPAARGSVRRPDAEEIAEPIMRAPVIPTPQVGVRTPYPMALILSLSLLMTMGVLTLASFLLLYVKIDLGLSGLQIGLLLLTLGVPVVALGLPLGHAADRWGKARAVRISLLASALLMWLVPSCRTLVAFSAVGTLLVTSHVLGIPAWLALAAELALPGRRGGMMGMVATAQGAGAVLGPLLGGWLWDMRHAYVFYGAATVLTLAALVAAVSLRHETSHVATAHYDGRAR